MCLATDSGRYVNDRSRDGIGMNRSAGGCTVKGLEQFQGLDTTLYKNLPLPFDENKVAIVMPIWARTFSKVDVKVNVIQIFL